MLAQLEPKDALTKAYGYLWLIGLILLLTLIFFVVMFMLRRWKRRQLKAIERDKAIRRAGQSAGRVDAWQASSERYVDHDKLAGEDEVFERNAGPKPPSGPDEDDPPPGGGADEAQETDDEERDPYGLFSDKPYQDPDDDEEDGFGSDDDDGWEDEEDPDQKP